MNDSSRESPRDTRRTVVPIVLGHICCLIAVALFTRFIGCPLRRLTGISCPGCGLSRAYLSFFRGDIIAAFSFHPLFFTAPLFFVAAEILYHGANRRPSLRRTLWIVIAAYVSLMVVTWIIRLICRDPVVVFHPENSLLSDLLRRLTGS